MAVIGQEVASRPGGAGDGPSRPSRGPRRVVAAGSGLTGGSRIGLGATVLWFSVLVLIPLAVVVGTAAAGGPGKFVAVLTSAQTVAAIGLTTLISLAVTVVNVITGTAIAWVLARDSFWGRGVIDVIIDIPFALPTIVAGLVLLSLYGPDSPFGVHLANTRWSVALAIGFVTLPFVVRAVQPVLEEMDTEVEEAATCLGAGPWTAFRRVVLPGLVPAIASGAGLSFARGISEYGSMVLLSGNLPNRTEVASVRVLTFIENGDLASASALATGMLLIAAVVIIGLELLRRRDRS